MTAVFKILFLLSARLWKFHNLAFLVIAMLCACNSNEADSIKIVWINNKASAVYLPKKLLDGIPGDSAGKFLKVTLSNSTDSTAILGELLVRSNIIFEPLLPFSRGSDYIVLYKNKKIGAFSVPPADPKNFPVLTDCYPRQDTLPENVLKVYLAFSHPMSEGHSEKYITLIKNKKDTLKDEFLNLQPELWNEDRTVLTIWFDPGRIKRDLQPNLKLGAPLKAFESYELVISDKWKDADGIAMQKDFTKFFVTRGRDSLSPVTNHWKLALPVKNSLNALIIDADETLDHYLFKECLHIKNDQGANVDGRFEVNDKDNSCSFFPASAWAVGNYTLMIDAKLEDLAGNNLNRPFDRDIMHSAEPLNKLVYERAFTIPDAPK